MSTNDVEIRFDASSVQEDLRDIEDAFDAGGSRAVNQVALLAEGAMKKEAPEGAGIPDNPLENTIEVRPAGIGPKKKTVMPHKRTREGWLLHRAIVGNPSIPTYTDERPPIPPLLEWVDAKNPIPGVDPLTQAFMVANKILSRGTQKTFPNPFIFRSVRQWESEVEKIAAEAIESERES